MWLKTSRCSSFDGEEREDEVYLFFGLVQNIDSSDGLQRLNDTWMLYAPDARYPPQIDDYVLIPASFRTKSMRNKFIEISTLSSLIFSVLSLVEDEKKTE